MELIFDALNIFVIILGWLVRPMLTFIYNKETNLPKIKDPVLLMSAKKLAKLIREKNITSAQIIATYIQRIHEVNPVINAVVDQRLEDAILEAKKIDKYIAAHKNPKLLEKLKPLLGVPISIKESCSVKGLSFAVGSRSRTDIIATEDGDAVRNLREAGAIILVVTNTPEFCACYETVNDVTGITKNPYNINKSSAGSSGGEGSLLGSGGSVIGIGSDTGGSNRLPAMFNGVFGHKTTPGIVPTKGHHPGGSLKELKSYLCIGPITRYAEDLKIVLSALAGNNRTVLKLDEEVKINTLKVYFMENCGTTLFGLNPVQNEIRQRIKESVKHLKEHHECEIMDYKFNELKNSLELALSIITHVKMPYLLGETNNIWLTILKEFWNLITGKGRFSFPIIMNQIFMELKFLIPTSKKAYYEEELKKLKDIMNRKLGTNGVFLYPTFTKSAFYHYESLFAMPGTVYVMIFNMLGFPATHIPMGLDKYGMPIGIQVVAAPKQDRLCFAIAEVLEPKFGGWVPPSGTIF